MNDSRGTGTTRLRVWIDQDLCTGDGLCVDYVPDVFTLLEDGIAYVVEGGTVCNDPGGASQTAGVPERLEQVVLAAASVCPGECIFVETTEKEWGRRSRGEGVGEKD